ncbi:MAG: hypothetical protein JXA89_23170 [Anaerolineae bacterium]|nr:hypothetical protein [Anaerolineae bacterium]
MKKNDNPLCPNDQFPMIAIHGQLECVAEYLLRCVGGKRVVDVVREGETGYYVFENGHELPLLCRCCGEPWPMNDLRDERQKIVGYQLYTMQTAPVDLEDGSVVTELILQFLKPGVTLSQFDVSVSIQVAAQMRHPSNCPHG